MILSIRFTEFTKLLAVITFGIFLSAKAFALSAIPAYSAPVIDQTSTLTLKQISVLSERLLTFSQSSQNKGAQIAVLMVNSLDGETIEQYATRVFEQWKIGQKSLDNGVLLVIAKTDRNVRIEVGYGLEGQLPDAAVKRIIDTAIIPAFKQVDYYQGISDAISKLISQIEQPTATVVTPTQSTEITKTVPETTNNAIVDVDDEESNSVFPYAIISFIVCLIYSRVSPNLKGQSSAQNVIVGVFNAISIGIYSLITGSVGSSILSTIFLTFVISTILSAILTGKMGGSGSNSNSRHYHHHHHFRGRRGGGSSSGRSGGGFSGGGGGRSGGGGASGSW